MGSVVKRFYSLPKYLLVLLIVISTVTILMIGGRDTVQARPIEFSYYEMIFSPRNANAERQAANFIDVRETEQYDSCMRTRGIGPFPNFKDAHLEIVFGNEGEPLNLVTLCIAEAESEKVAVFRAVQPYLRVAFESFNVAFGLKGRQADLKYVDCMAEAGFQIEKFISNTSLPPGADQAHQECGAVPNKLRDEAVHLAQKSFEATHRREVLEVIRLAMSGVK